MAECAFLILLINALNVTFSAFQAAGIKRNLCNTTFFLQPKQQNTEADESDRDSSSMKAQRFQQKGLQMKESCYHDVNTPYRKLKREHYEQQDRHSHENEDNHSSLSNSHDINMSPPTPPPSATNYRSARKRKGTPFRAHLGSLIYPSYVC
eukprot:TRINITY_DN2019_c0_g1_i1.p1 TRINITY_DN2019_c0_g1~~TRINITY_DN2019_c0_g1_i1.p1  ORF type:complete len:151 (-),score=24.67 TRINITY_DN2019_c0_g1_i1:695-1147(-)